MYTLDSLSIRCTTFPDARAKRKQEHALTWGKLREQLAAPEVKPTKEDCELIKVATFGDTRTAAGCFRHNANVTTVFGIEGDHDAGLVSPVAAAAMLKTAGVEALVVTTASHTADHPRWRVFAPLSAPCTPSERRLLCGLLNDALGGILASESFTLSQSYYYGRVEGVPFEAHHISGRPIDEFDIVLSPVYAQATPKVIADSAREAANDFDPLEAKQPQGATFGEMATLLDKLDPGMSRALWLRVLAGIHQETGGSEAGCVLVLEWSARGANFDSEQDVRARWNSFKRDTRPNAVTLSTVRMMAKAAETARQAPTRAERTPTFQVIDANEYCERPAPDWLIKGVIPRRGVGLAYGASQSGKSFLVGDIAGAIAAGNPWRGRKTRSGKVVTVVAEGAAAYSRRLQAHRNHHGALPSGVLGVASNAPNLQRDEDIEAIANAVKAFGGAQLVVIDTLAASTAGADENSAQDMGAVMARCGQLEELLQAPVLLIHHSGKDATKGARGSSAIRAALDFEIEVLRDGDSRQARITKMRDGEDGAVFPFRLLVVAVGTDDDGDQITSCVVEHLNTAPQVVVREPKGRLERVVYTAARDMLPELCVGAVDDLIAEVIRREPRSEDKKRDRRREYITRAVGSLAEAGLIHVDGLEVSMPHASSMPHEAREEKRQATDLMPHMPHTPIGVRHEASDAVTEKGKKTAPHVARGKAAQNGMAR